MANEWPGVGTKIANAAEMVMAGKVPTDASILVRPYEYYHRKDVAATNNELTFFNEAADGFGTNWPSQGGLPSEHILVLESIRATIDFGYEVDGAAGSAGLNTSFASDTIVAASARIAEDVHQLYSRGQMKMSIADRTIIQSDSLYNFPPGAGPAVDIDLQRELASGATDAHISQFITNGQPTTLNVNIFGPPVPILPNKIVKIGVKWPFTRSLTPSAAFTLKLALHGTLITPSEI